MAEDYNKLVKEHPLCILATELGVYRFKEVVKTEKSAATILKRIATLIEKKKDNLTEAQLKVYQEALGELQQKPKKEQSEANTPAEQTSKQPEVQQQQVQPEAEVKADATPAPEVAQPQKVQSENTLEKDGFYQIAKLIGMDVSIYDPEDANVGKKLSKDLNGKIAQNTDEENQKIKDILKGNKYLLTKFEKTLAKEQEKKQKGKKDNVSKPKKDNLSKTPKKTGENKMTDTTDFNAKLKGEALYKLAEALPEPKINLGEYTATDEASYKEALAKLKDVVKKRTQDEKQRAEDMKALKDKDELKKEYETIEKEGKPAPEATRETVNVHGTTENEEPTPEKSWVAEKKAFWAQYATENTLASDFTVPEGDESPFYCKLSKDEKEVGSISYSSPKDVKISKDSGLKLYQGLVKDAVQNELSITFGNSLGEHQQLMLYAAVLLSDDKYKSGDKVQVVNPPALSVDKINADKSLPEEAKNALLAEIKRREEEKRKEVAAHIEQLRKIVEARKAKMTPEEQAERDAKQLERDKIMAARLGITGKYDTTYGHDIKDEKGNVIHKATDKREVNQDKKLFNNDGSVKNSYKEIYDALAKRKAELGGK